MKKCYVITNSSGFWYYKTKSVVDYIPIKDLLYIKLIKYRGRRIITRGAIKSFVIQWNGTL